MGLIYLREDCYLLTNILGAAAYYGRVSILQNTIEKLKHQIDFKAYEKSDKEKKFKRVKYALYTPLMLAVTKGNLESAKILLQNGAN